MVVKSLIAACQPRSDRQQLHGLRILCKKIFKPEPVPRNVSFLGQAGERLVGIFLPLRLFFLFLSLAWRLNALREVVATPLPEIALTRCAKKVRPGSVMISIKVHDHDE